MSADTLMAEIADCDREVALMKKSVDTHDIELMTFKELLAESKNRASKLRASLATKLYQLSEPSNGN